MRRTYLALAVLIPAASGCVSQDDDKPTAEDMKMVQQNILKTAPTPKYPANADLDGKVTYVGFDVSPDPVEPGKDAKLTHYWKVNSAPGEGWRLFVHISGPNGVSQMNTDHGPVRGKYPVSQWKAGEIIRDEHTIRLPATWAHSKMEVHTGLWKGNTRMPIKSGPKDSEGRVTLAVSTSGGKVVAPRKRLLVRKAAKPIKVDGKLDEADWKDAASTGPFVNTLTGTPVELRTEAKLLWDAKNLYIAVENADPDAWSNLTKHDDKLWTQEADEVMIDADGDGKSYIELQVAPNGTTFDTYLPKYREYEDSLDPKRKKYAWDSKMKVAVKVDGTINKREDTDRSWTVEMAIPLEDAKGEAATGPKVPPELGDVWRVNLFRMDMPQNKPQMAAGWSPPMVGDFHALDRFGEIVFADEKGNVPAGAAGGEGKAPAVGLPTAVVAGASPAPTPGAGPGPRLPMRAPLLAPGLQAMDPNSPQLDIGAAVRGTGKVAPPAGGGSGKPAPAPKK